MSGSYKWLCKVDESGKPLKWFPRTTRLSERQDMIPVSGKNVSPTMSEIGARWSTYKSSSCLAEDIGVRLKAYLSLYHSGLEKNDNFVERLQVAVAYFLDGTDKQQIAPSESVRMMSKMIKATDKIEELWDRLDSMAENELILVSMQLYDVTPDDLRLWQSRLSNVFKETAERVGESQKPRSNKSRSTGDNPKRHGRSLQKEYKLQLLVKIGEAIEDCLEEKANTAENGLFVRVAHGVLNCISETETETGFHPEDIVEAVRILRYQYWAFIRRQIVMLENSFSQLADEKGLALIQERVSSLKNELLDYERTLPKKTVLAFRCSSDSWEEQFLQRKRRNR